VYNLEPEDLDALMDPVYHYHQVLDLAGNLIGYCCFGADAQVPGGEYPQDGAKFLDIGVGMHPDLVGKGLGRGFVSAVLMYASNTYEPEYFRVTIANFNQRSLKTFRKLGFVNTVHFYRMPDGMHFTQLERKAYE
jgi:RimJ/RimL family protein N-acetyltransferase